MKICPSFATYKGEKAVAVVYLGCMSYILSVSFPFLSNHSFGTDTWKIQLYRKKRYRICAFPFGVHHQTAS